MKIMPVYHFLKWYEQHSSEYPSLFFYDSHLWRYSRKAMVLVVPAGMEFPVGTPDHTRIRNTDVWVFRGHINHFHTLGDGTRVPAGFDPSGFAVANSTRLGRGRKVLRDLAQQYPFVDPVQQAYQLRKLVREGD